METLSGKKTQRSVNNDACKINPPDNYLVAWNQGKNLQKVNEEDEDQTQGVVEQGLSRQVVQNYVIMKNVLSLLSWQDLKLCSRVCKLWRDIVINVQKENHSPHYFYVVKQSDELVLAMDLVQCEPLLVLVFFNKTCQVTSFPCQQFSNLSCTIIKNHKHKILDYANMAISYPGKSMMALKGSTLVFIEKTNVYDGASVDKRRIANTPFLGGLVIPTISDLQVHRIKANANTSCSAAYGKIYKLLETNNVMCMLVFVAGMISLRSVKVIEFVVQKIRELQPDEPYALGGCAVNNAIVENFHTEVKTKFHPDIHFVILSMPKGSANPENFNAYSIVIEDHKNPSAHCKSKIEEFSTSIPKQRHIAGLKLSCTDRVELHTLEKDYWKRFFPTTSLVGCYGSGEIGLDCYPKDYSPAHKKRNGADSVDCIYSSSTVLVVLSWGPKTET